MPERQRVSVYDLIEKLPMQIRSRFQHYPAYIDSLIDEELGNQSEPLSSHAREMIRVIAFAKLLRDFLLEGTRVARVSAFEFQKLGLEGFQIGSTVFTSMNEATLRGQKLAEALSESLAEYGKVREYLRKSLTPQALVQALLKEVKDHDALGGPGQA